MSTDRLFRWLLSIQLLAVLAVCFNHLSITLLKMTPPLFSDLAYTLPANWGINALFLSSGFLLYWRRNTIIPEQAAVAGTLGFLTRRFLFLALPCYAAYLVDALLLSFNDFGPSAQLATVAPILLTLSQTWLYGTVGMVSIGQPLNVSNMAWFGSVFFFLAIVFGLTRGVFQRLGQYAALGALLVFVALHYAQFHVLAQNAQSLSAEAAALYGDRLAPSYTLGAWLVQYSPYAQLLTFLAGIALARWIEQGGHRTLYGVIATALLLGATVLFPPMPVTIFLAVNVALVVVLARLADSNGVASEGKSAGGALASAWGRLSEQAYGVLVLHMVLYVPLTHRGTFSGLGAWLPAYMTGRVAIVTAAMLLFSYGLCVLVLEPLRRKLLSILHVENANDHFV